MAIFERLRDKELIYKALYKFSCLLHLYIAKKERKGEGCIIHSFINTFTE